MGAHMCQKRSASEKRRGKVDMEKVVMFEERLVEDIEKLEEEVIMSNTRSRLNISTDLVSTYSINDPVIEIDIDSCNKKTIY